MAPSTIASTAGPLRSLAVLALILVPLVLAGTAKAGQVLFTFREMQLLQSLPAEATKRALSEEEVTLYHNYEFYAYSVFEALQVANEASILIHDAPLFCAPDATFKFREDDSIINLANYVTAELFALTEQVGGPLTRYDDKPASAVLLLGLRAAFPCPDPATRVAQR